MSGYLNLGGTGGASSRSAPARALDTTFVPSTERPVLVAYRVRITCPAGADRGAIELRSDTSAPPVTVLAAFGGGLAAAGTVFEGTLVALVLPGNNVRIVTVVVAGAPAFVLLGTSETVL